MYEEALEYSHQCLFVSQKTKILQIHRKMRQRLKKCGSKSKDASFSEEILFRISYPCRFLQAKSTLG